MLTKIEDETGQVWFIGKDDPAYPAVQKLKTLHYSWIVLIRHQITGGPGAENAPAWWKIALRTAHRIGYNTDEGKRHLRLAECLKVLEG